MGIVAGNARCVNKNGVTSPRVSRRSSMLAFNIEFRGLSAYNFSHDRYHIHPSTRPSSTPSTSTSSQVISPQPQYQEFCRCAGAGVTGFSARSSP